MVQPIMRDPIFLARPSAPATPEDVQRLRGEMLRTTKGDLMKFADVLDGLTKDASICVIGGGEAFDTATNQLQRVESVQ